MIQNDAHGNPPLGGEHSAINGIFVHPQYGPVQLNVRGPRTSHTASVHILRNLVAPCILGVQLDTTLMAIHHSPLNTVQSMELSYTCCVEL